MKIYKSQVSDIEIEEICHVLQESLIKGWNEFVTAVHLCMQINLKNEDIMIIERKFKNFYNHISK